MALAFNSLRHMINEKYCVSEVNLARLSSTVAHHTVGSAPLRDPKKKKKPRFSNRGNKLAAYGIFRPLDARQPSRQRGT